MSALNKKQLRTASLLVCDGLLNTVSLPLILYYSNGLELLFYFCFAKTVKNMSSEVNEITILSFVYSFVVSCITCVCYNYWDYQVKTLLFLNIIIFLFLIVYNNGFVVFTDTNILEKNFTNIIMRSSVSLGTAGVLGPISIMLVMSFVFQVLYIIGLKMNWLAIDMFPDKLKKIYKKMHNNKSE